MSLGRQPEWSWVGVRRCPAVRSESVHSLHEPRGTTRAPSAERRVQPRGVVVGVPVRGQVDGVANARETMLVQEFVERLAVEALGERVLDRLARPDEVVLDPVFVCTGVEVPRGEIWADVGADRSRLCPGARRPRRGCRSLTAPAVTRHLCGRSARRESSSSGEDTQSAPVGQRVTEEVHRSARVPRRRLRSRHSRRLGNAPARHASHGELEFAG